MKHMEHGYSYIPKPLKLVNSGEQLSRVLDFRRVEYRKKYPNLPVASHDPYDQHAHILFTEDKNQDINSTARLVLDSPVGLPEDVIFPPIVDQYRNEGKRLMVIGRFIIRDGSHKLLKKYYHAFYEIARSERVDYVVIILRQKDVAFHRKLFGIDILVEQLDNSYGSDLTLMYAGWNLDNTRPAFFKWIGQDS